MGIDLVNYEQKIRDSVKAFWGNRESAQRKKIESGKVDQGTRGAVTAGKNMDGFLALMLDIVAANGLPEATIRRNRRALTLPGFFRPTKLWDLLVINQGRLVAALEFKSQVGSFGNNCNNRCEEALGTAIDFWTAYRENAFGEIPRPFVGWLMLIEDSENSRKAVKDASANFPIFPEFKDASYSDRYKLLCEKLIKENLYTAAAFMRSPRSAITTGEYSELSDTAGIKNFIATFAAHIAAESVRSA